MGEQISLFGMNNHSQGWQMASPQTPPPKKEGLEIQVIKSHSLTGRGGFRG